MHGIQGITGIRGIGYRRRRGGGVTPGPSWPSAPVAGLHVYSEAGPAWCRQFADGTGSVVADDPVGYLHNAGTLETPFTQETTGARPLIEWDEEREAWYLQFDGVDDSLLMLLDAYTVCDIWVAFTGVTSRGSGNYPGVMQTVADGPGDALYWNHNNAEYRWFEGSGGDGSGHVATGGFEVYRKVATVGNPSHRVYAYQVATPAEKNPQLVIKDRLALGVTRVASATYYGDPHIYAIAATIGSVMSTEQVNAIKADWSAKFGVEFAW